MIFSPKDPLMFGDAAQLAIKAVTGAFTVGLQMSAPFIVLGLVFNLGMGSASKNTGLLAFKTMKTAIEASDWKKAAAACHRKGPSEARNNWTRDRFLESAP